MLEIKDQMNNIIRLETFPGRIISIVPSQTELLFDMEWKTFNGGERCGEFMDDGLVSYIHHRS